MELLEIVKIRDHLHIIYGRSGFGSNVGVSVGDDGILLIDAMNGRQDEALLKTIRGLSDAPVRYVINTHSDRDHTGGNAVFAEQGATIFGQENARYSKALVHAYFKTKMLLNANGERVEAHHVPSHSHNDALIYLPVSNVVFLGDTFTTSWHPTFYSAGLAGQFEIVERALALADDATVIIPGHGVISDRQGLLKFRNQSASWLERVGALHRQGLGVEAIQSDDQVQRIKESFLAQANGKEIPEDRFQRFIQRTISTELIPRYPLMGSTASRYVGRYELEDGSSLRDHRPARHALRPQRRRVPGRVDPGLRDPIPPPWLDPGSLSFPCRRDRPDR